MSDRQQYQISIPMDDRHDTLGWIDFRNKIADALRAGGIEVDGTGMGCGNADVFVYNPDDKKVLSS